ncbi:uncharacterized protein LOC123380391 isoform X1 [Felis catus]|uniref:uncharacterized protein LOC123380391 isoform X1 n=1 Tax=Felis catus TaxID=9685 RepID=UPI001D19EE20|nr:uncharacterized protein LOC123380391 isoform X1 [Felis catus]
MSQKWVSGCCCCFCWAFSQWSSWMKVKPVKEAVMGGERLYGEEMEVVSKVGFLGYCKMAQGEFFFFFSQISVAPNQNGFDFAMIVISMMDSNAVVPRNVAGSLIYPSNPIRVAPQITITTMIQLQGDICTDIQNCLVILVKRECSKHTMTYREKHFAALINICVILDMIFWKSQRFLEKIKNTLSMMMSYHNLKLSSQ